MTDLNDFFYTDGVDDVLAVYVNNLLASSLRSEYKNAELLSADRELTDADTPIQRFDCGGADRLITMPPADAVENHLYLIVNASDGGEIITLKNNDETITYATIAEGSSLMCMPDGDGGYVVAVFGLSDLFLLKTGLSHWSEQSSTPSSPASGRMMLFFKNDEQLYKLNPAGTLSKYRETLTANRIYYVRTDGNDSNTGLANTSGAAFLTIQKAVDVAATLDLSTYDVVIQLGTGTWTESVTMKNAVGAGTIIIQGDLITPSNTVVRNFTKTSNGTKYTIKDLKFTGSSTYAAIAISNGALVSFGNVEFGTGYTVHIESIFGAKIECDNSYTISGGASAHLSVRAGGGAAIQAKTITLSGTPAFGTTGTYGFVECRYTCTVFINGNTFSGSATGRRYYVDYNAVIQSAGATLPGNAAGATANGGLYG